MNIHEAVGRTDIKTIVYPLDRDEWRKRVESPLRAQELAFLEQGRELLSLSGAVGMLTGVQKLLLENGVQDARRANVSLGPWMKIQDSLRHAVTHHLGGDETDYRAGENAGSVITELGWNYQESRDNKRHVNTLSRNQIAVTVFTATGDIMINNDGEQVVPQRIWETRSGKTLLEDMVAAAYNTPLSVKLQIPLDY